MVSRGGFVGDHEEDQGRGGQVVGLAEHECGEERRLGRLPLEAQAEDEAVVCVRAIIIELLNHGQLDRGLNYPPFGDELQPR